MVDYMNLEEQVDVDFGRARRQAFFGGLKTRFVGGATVCSPSTRSGEH